jgi:regulator of cell morphogenesis and NO signaling
VSVTIENSTSLRTLVAERPARVRLFELLRLDYCCGGAHSLAEACRGRGLDPDTVRELLEATEQDGQAGADPAEERDWGRAAIEELCDHVVSVHHRRVREEAPRISELAATVVRVHGGDHPELQSVERAFAGLRDELEPHLAEEERQLFPACTALEREGTAPADFVAAVDRHEAEHAEVGRDLVALRELAGGYDEEAALCSTHRSLLAALRDFEADLHRHVHEENNVLFPRVRELAAAGDHGRHGGGGDELA